MQIQVKIFDLSNAAGDFETCAARKIQDWMFDEVAFPCPDFSNDAVGGKEDKKG